MGAARKNMENRQHTMDAVAPAMLRSMGFARNAHSTAKITTVLLPYWMDSMEHHTSAAIVIVPKQPFYGLGIACTGGHIH